MSRTFERYDDRITAQANAAFSAGDFSTGSQTLVDKAASMNGDGAQWFDCYVDVTAAASSDATCEMWITGSSDGTDESAYEYALSCPIPASTTDQFRLGPLYGTPQEFKAKIKAVGYGFSATLYITPAYTADA